MAKSINKLSPRKVATITKPGFHGDGLGLWLKVSPNGNKSWVFRYTVQKKQLTLA